MRVLLLLVAVAITTAYASSFLKDEEYATVEERKQAMDEAIEEAKAAVNAKELAKKNRVTTQNEKNGNYTSSQLLAKFFKKPSEDARKMGNAYLMYRDIINRAERKMFNIKRAKVAETQGNMARAESLAEMLFHRPGTMLSSQEIARAWQEAGNIMDHSPRVTPNCNFPTIFIYRTIDGTCNNINKPLLGASGTALRRLVPALYEDGVGSLRGSLQAQSTILSSPFLPPNPSVRLISEVVVLDVAQDEVPFSYLMMQWGQFLDHDLGQTPGLVGHCKGCEFSEICQPIRVSSEDKSFGTGTRNSGNCLPFRRSVPVFNAESSQTLMPRDQLNDVTAYIDGSMIYGSRLQQSQSLRFFRGGLLREGTNFPQNKPTLPIDTENLVACPNRMDCFLCGDVRCNEQVSLTIMHTIWLREHNRCARELSRINWFWDDEKLYQTCRKIVGALIQKITYEDYLPKVMGKENYDRFIGHYRGYNPAVDPSIPNSFSTAAYRYGHSLVRPTFDRLNKHYHSLPIGPLNLVDAFFRPDQFKTSLGTDPIIRGWVSVNSRRMDEFLTSVLTTQLFQTPSSPGMDLASLNLQRGRDHGLPSYPIYQHFCFQQFGLTSGFENELTHARLLEIYGSLDTAELWIAGLAEKRLNGGLLGPIFACIFGLTFQGVREGDRFFWLNPGVFTHEQRNSIGSDSIARVISDNSDGIASIQPDAFLSNQNPIPSSSLRRIDLNLFREQPCFFGVYVLKRSFTGAISIFSHSTQPQYDFVTRHIPPSESVLYACVPVQCPTRHKPTTVVIYSSNTLLQDTTIYQNEKLPKNLLKYINLYKAVWTFSDFNSGRGLFMDTICKISEGSFVFKFVRKHAIQSLQEDWLVKLAAETDGTGISSEPQSSYMDIVKTNEEMETDPSVTDLLAGFSPISPESDPLAKLSAETDLFAELSQETDGTDTGSDPESSYLDMTKMQLPMPILNMVKPNDTYMALEGVEGANFDSTSGAEDAMKQQEVKKTSSLFRELEEAMKELN